LVDTMAGVARDNLREHGRSGDASAFGMHQADAGSDAYDRDSRFICFLRSKMRSTRSTKR
jgi:hypothetical protein